MSKGPRVTRMVMFKHGVAYLERGGPAEGAFELSFKRDEMNDVLKSLAVWVARGEARVGAVAFEAPEDPDASLAERKLLLGAGAALSGLLSSLRGRRVHVDDGGAAREGEVIGVESTPGGDGPERQRLVLRTDEGTVTLVDLAAVRSLSLLEPPSRADLEFLVDRSRASTAGASRIVRIALDGRADDLRVAYVIPSPVWRVSYRVSISGDKTLLVAWGIVHNPADEDVDQIDLTLTTGQPVSFVIDLYHPKRVQRAVVEEESRAAAAPTRFERARAAPPPPPAAAPMAMAKPQAPPAPGPAGGYGAPEPMLRSLGESLQASAEGASLGVDRGEFFEYRVQAKVSLKRGGSAMVPLVAARIDAKKQRIWRDGAGPSPDLVLTFKNDAGVVLEEGPAVVYDEDTYAGESMVPYSARGAEVKLGFAKDLAVRCRRASTHNAVLSAVRIGPNATAALIEEHRREEHHTLSAESDHADEVEVWFELPKVHGRSLSPEGAQPAEETASFRRFVAKIPPHGKTELLVREQWLEARHVRYDTLSASQLQHWLNNRFLDQATFELLRGVLAKWQEAAQLDARRQRVEREQQEAYAKQTKISEQLGVLKDGGPEGTLRLRYVKELEAEQDKVNAAEAEVRRLRDAADAARNEASAALENLTRQRG